MIQNGGFILRILICLAFLINSISTIAHTVVLAQYSMRLDNGLWVLNFEQKTGHLRDEIYARNPALKGINLNSEAFLSATAAYIKETLNLKTESKDFELDPIYMRYGGLRFESQFIIPDLPKSPDRISIRAEGFDTHEHSIVVFRIEIDNGGYLHQFSQDQRFASFDFISRSYNMSEANTQNWTLNRLWALIPFLILLGLGIKRYRRRFTEGKTG